MIKDIGVVYKGASLTYEWDWNNYLARKGTSASSSAWSTDNGAITIANDSLASGKAAVQITGAYEGCAILKNNVVFADGDDDFAYFKVTVVDPECEGASNTDYE